MFSIEIGIIAEEFSGLEALDERRRLKLPDGSRLTTETCYYVKVDVSEGFARLHFDKTSTHIFQRVRIASLTPDDVVIAGQNTNHVALNKDMPAERVRELWVASKYSD